SSLGGCVVGACVLDLFAGTGALGLEAASRGAASATFVENARGPLECLEGNVGEFIKRLRDKNVAPTIFDITQGDVATVLERMKTGGQRFSIIFADPPYGEAAQELLRDDRLRSLLVNDGLFVLESAKRDVLTVSRPWALVRDGVYGDTRVSFLRTKC
ncbi:MAG TPA: RsmD family RNA methyltransferase, partial [Verrucomicrobiae bacterium]|nr:RsmD family RNA methyltransferase [Verrucomicrobiae bacterium]